MECLQFSAPKTAMYLLAALQSLLITGPFDIINQVFHLFHLLDNAFNTLLAKYFINLGYQKVIGFKFCFNEIFTTKQ